MFFMFGQKVLESRLRYAVKRHASPPGGILQNVIYFVRSGLADLENLENHTYRA